MTSTYKPKKHAAFLVRCLRGMPPSAISLDSNRMTLAYFLVASLDLIGALFTDTKQEDREDWIEWVWDQQLPAGGFRGSPFSGPFDDACSSSSSPSPTHSASQAHLASSYTALLLLSLLRAPMDRLNRPGLISFVKSCQLDVGSFSPLRVEMNAEDDVRMVLCACVISDLLGDWSGIDVGKARGFVERCLTYEGGYGQRPGQEAQGGTTYCSLVSLRLLSTAPSSSTSSTSSSSPTSPSTLPVSSFPPPSTSRKTISWCLHRQIPQFTLPPPSEELRGGGFQGRTGKKGDACYSFWVGGALCVLGAGSLVSASPNRVFVLRCQSPVGGFGKAPGERPDPFHTYTSLAALSLLKSDEEEDLGLGEMDPVRNVGVGAMRWLEQERERLGWLKKTKEE